MKNCTVNMGLWCDGVKVGSESWWQSKHGPEWQRLNTKCLRSLSGGVIPKVLKNTRDKARMGLHHWCDRSPSEQPAQSMQRIAGTDVWQWTTQLNPTGAAATALFLLNAMTFFLHIPRSPRITRRLAKTITPGDTDPLNPQSWKGGRGHAVSALKCRKRPYNRVGIVRKRQKRLQRNYLEK